MATRLKGCGRGVFGLKTWEQQPIPPGLADRLKQNMSAVQNQTSSQNGESSQQSTKKVREPPTKVPKVGQGIVAKFNYKANPNEPIGPELSLKQGDKLKFVSSTSSNPYWWMAENEVGEQGFIPASYMVILEVTSLPWLQNREPDPEEEIDPNHKPVFKPYVATYDLKGVAKGSDKFHCEVCQKFFNGPLPYNAHMNSKAHKEEVEVQEAYANMD